MSENTTVADTSLLDAPAAGATAGDPLADLDAGDTHDPLSVPRKAEEVRRGVLYLGTLRPRTINRGNTTQPVLVTGESAWPGDFGTKTALVVTRVADKQRHENGAFVLRAIHYKPKETNIDAILAGGLDPSKTPFKVDNPIGMHERTMKSSTGPWKQIVCTLWGLVTLTLQPTRSGDGSMNLRADGLYDRDYTLAPRNKASDFLETAGVATSPTKSAPSTPPVEISF